MFYPYFCLLDHFLCGNFDLKWFLNTEMKKPNAPLPYTGRWKELQHSENWNRLKNGGGGRHPSFMPLFKTLFPGYFLLCRSHFPFKLSHLWIIFWAPAIEQFHFKSSKTKERFLKMEGTSLWKSASGRENNANKCSCDCFKIHRIGRF